MLWFFEDTGLFKIGFSSFSVSYLLIWPKLILSITGFLWGDRLCTTTLRSGVKAAFICGLSLSLKGEEEIGFENLYGCG